MIRPITANDEEEMLKMLKNEHSNEKEQLENKDKKNSRESLQNKEKRNSKTSKGHRHDSSLSPKTRALLDSFNN